LNRLPAPNSLRVWWNLGSFLGIMIVVQILRGWFLTLFYWNSREISFISIWEAHLDFNHASFLHWIHINFASFIFLIIYLHLLKGLFYQSWKINKLVWIRGVVILILVIATAFLGYVLPWAQISLWAATVITNLLSVISRNLVIWVWGGYSVNSVTLSLFFTLHYLLPIILIVLILIHLLLLHGSGRISSVTSSIKMSFSPLYLFKDALNLVFLSIFFCWVMTRTYYRSDVENFALANPIRRPIHIQPEWYFLQYYAILRRIPNKVLGIIFFVLRLIFFIFLTFNSFKRVEFYLPFWNNLIRVFLIVNILLILLGASPVEPPYLIMGQILTSIYFFWFFLLFIFARGVLYEEG